MSFSVKPISTIGLCAVLFMLPACKQDIEPRDVNSEMRHIMSAYDISSVAACVIKDNVIVWQNIYGYSDKENQVPASEETIYNVGSVSKLIIATAVFQLVEKGRLDIDDDINHYIPVSIRNPHFPGVPITAKMLMTHSAGIAWPLSYSEALGLWEHFDPDKAPAPSEWVPQFLTPGGQFYNPLIWKNTEPGTFELYSNIGASLLAYLVEQISGQDFRAYCRNNIFIPLNMNRTSYRYADLDRSKIAVFYKHNNTINPPYDVRIYPSGGLKSTMDDFSRFLMAYLNGGEYGGSRILQQASVDRLLEVQNPASGVCLIWKASMGGWFGHTGGMEAGAASIVEIHRREKLGMIIFCNKHSDAVYHGNEIFGLIRQKVNEY